MPVFCQTPIPEPNAGPRLSPEMGLWLETALGGEFCLGHAYVCLGHGMGFQKMKLHSMTKADISFTKRKFSAQGRFQPEAHFLEPHSVT